MRKLPYLLLMILPFLLGMGTFSGDVSPEMIPKPAKKFTAVFTDQLDVITECREVSIEGSTYLEGKRGEGKMMINFEHIHHISFSQTGGKFTARVRLGDGSSLELSVNKDQRAYGRTAYGVFVIKLADLKRMQFTGPAPK